MGSVMFCGYVKNSKLPVLSPNLAPPKPPTIPVEEHGSQMINGTSSEKRDGEQACLSLAAGKCSNLSD